MASGVPTPFVAVDTIAFKAYILRCFPLTNHRTGVRDVVAKGIQCEIMTVAR
jgi:hypothetical protein